MELNIFEVAKTYSEITRIDRTYIISENTCEARLVVDPDMMTVITIIDQDVIRIEVDNGDGVLLATSQQRIQAKESLHHIFKHLVTRYE